MAEAEPVTVVIEDEDNSVRVDPDSGNVETDTPDGGVVVQFDAARKQQQDESKFYDNLAIDMDPMRLGQISNELIDAIEADDRSRSQYLETIARGLELMGLRLEDPRSSVADTGAAIDGMSSVTNPLLLETVLKGWANARAELLPAEGPVKIDEQGDETPAQDDLGEVLERDMNLYLTKVAKEYYPDTSHMLLWGPHLRGSGIKKIYRCPMRRRPVSESVDTKDFIVSDATKDLRSCSRITHQISMRPSVMKRMMHLGAYRDVELTQPNPTPNRVDNKLALMEGVQPTKDRPEDNPYTLYETQCELDLDEGFEHPSMSGNDLKDKGIPLPYIVTLDKDSREILALRRDWHEDDKECERKRLYVKYPYVPGPGFYGTGLLQILGNCTAAMTAAWRQALDAGTFANFPAGFIAKLGSRQNTSNVRLGPGEFAPIETGGQKIGDVVTGLPYKDVTGGLLNLMRLITAQAKELGGSADIPAAEGIANIPVGTMLAQIEQATKVMSSTHKDMHQAQSEEIEMIVDLFRENPEDFWRNRHIKPDFWDEQKLLSALNDYKLISRSDPNTPSHIHRVMKAVAYVNIMTTPLAPFFNGKMIAEMVVRALRDDPSSGIVVDPPPQQGGDPTQAAVAQAKLIQAQTGQQKVAVDAAKLNTQAQSDASDANIKMAELAGEQRIQDTRLATEQVIHRNDSLNDQRDFVLGMHDAHLKERSQNLDEAVAQHDAAMDHQEHALDQFEATKPEPQPTAKPKK